MHRCCAPSISIPWQRRLRTWVWVTCLLLATAPLHAKIARVSLRVELAGPGPASSEPEVVAVRAEAISSTGEQRGSEIRFENIKLPGTSLLGLDDRHVWKLELDAEGFWAAPQIVALGDSTARFRAWPVGRMGGSVQVPEGEERPGELTLRFESSLQDSGATDAPSLQGETTCPVREGRYSCELPASELDVRLRAKGFVSHYLWSVAVPAGGSRDLGTLRLVPGASVVGSVAAEAGTLSPEKCRVVLAPEAAGGARSLSDHRRQEAAGLEASVTSRGFFHFEGVATGAYRLSVSHAGYATTELAPVSVLPRSETMISRPFVLRRPVDLELFLEPAADPFGKPWAIEVARWGPIPGTLDPVGEGTADLAGSFVLGGLDPGEHVVSVYDSRGSRFAWEELVLSRESGPQFVQLDVLWVEGLISLGDVALEASLTFGGRNGTNRIVMESGEEGEFGGYLPEAGEWEVYVESDLAQVSSTVFVDVDRDEDGAATLTIELPDTRVEGRVVDERRRGVEGATVKAVDADSGMITWRTSRSDGEFGFRGLDEGALVIDASLGEGLSSDPAILSLSEDRRQAPVTLILREAERLSGRVVSSSGPVPGALVIVIPKRGGLELPFSRRPHALTDPTGAFTVRVPADVDRLDLVIMPPGFALTTAVLPGSPDDRVELAVEEHGGDLALVLGDRDGVLDQRGAPSPLVLREGVVLDEAILRRWASLKLAQNPDPTRLTVPAMAPGEYSACWFSYETFADSLARGTWAAPAGAGTGNCAQGFLPPYGDLSLELPDPENSAAAEGAKGVSEPGA